MVIAVSDDGRVVELYEDGTWSPSNQVRPAAGDFRGVSWGASAQAVREREARPNKLESDEVLVYDERISDMNADAVYIFAGKRLVRAKYMFTDEYTSPNRYVAAFHRVNSLFSRKYGAPSEESVWHDDFYRDNYEEWGRAVERGDLTLIASWTTPHTELALILYGNDYESHLEVEYASIALKSWAESIDNASTHDLI